MEASIEAPITSAETASMEPSTEEVEAMDVSMEPSTEAVEAMEASMEVVEASIHSRKVVEVNYNRLKSAEANRNPLPRKLPWKLLLGTSTEASTSKSHGSFGLLWK